MSTGALDNVSAVHSSLPGTCEIGIVIPHEAYM